MPNEFRVDIANTSGVKKYELTGQPGGFLALSYGRRVNEPGLARVVVAADHGLGGNIADKWLVTCYRRNIDLGLTDWTAEFYGLYRDINREAQLPGQIELLCPGVLHMLGWRHILWYAGTYNRSEFISKKAETVMKTLVTYNATSSATTSAGRFRAGQISGITVETDGAHGNTVDWYCFRDNLLESLQELAKIAGGDFDLIETGAAAWQFRWYTGQRGTDLTSTVKFGLGLDNMGAARYIAQRRQEKTVNVALGHGEGSARVYEIRTGSNYSASNDIESVIDAKSIGTSQGLKDRADRYLADNEALIRWEFDILQTPATAFGVHYGLGDKVTAINPFDDSEETIKIAGYQIEAASEKQGSLITITPEPA